MASQPTEALTRNISRRAAPPLVAAIIGIAGSILLWDAISSRETRLANLELSTATSNYVSVLQNGINDYLDKLQAAGAFFSSVESVSRQEFMDYTETLLRGAPAILAITWVPRVLADERAAHEKRAALEGYANYKIRAKGDGGTLVAAPYRSEYFPVFYSTAASPSTPWVGTNMDDGLNRGETLARARRTGEPATSRRIQLLSGTGDGTGFFVMVPVYRAGPKPHNRAAVQGILQGAFQTKVMVQRIIESSLAPSGIDLYFVEADQTDESILHFHPSRLRRMSVTPLTLQDVKAGLHGSAELNFGDRKWELLAAPISGGPGHAHRLGSWLALVGGLSLTLLVSAFLWATEGNALRMRKKNIELDHALTVVDRTNGELLTQNTRFDAALNNMSQGLVMFDASERIVVLNDRYLEIYRLPKDQVKPGLPLKELLHLRYSDFRLPQNAEDTRKEILAGIAAEGGANYSIETIDGRTIAISGRAMAGGGWVSTHEDVTERRRAEAEITYLARHDALTDLPNRRMFAENLQKRLAEVPQLAVLCLDVDRFKSVNDALGHSIGDKLLTVIANRLRNCVREDDIVARLGGDEFAVVQVGFSKPSDATELATRIIEVTSAPFDLEGHQIVVGMSVGISICPLDGDNPEVLLKNADMALYRAKSDGRGVYRFFESEMDARMQQRRALEIDLRKALAQGEFELFYQPLVDTKTAQIRGFEALLRWQHPQRGTIAPGEFISLTEETGLIVPLGDWIIRQACQEAGTWPTEYSVAVNLSPVQFKNKSLLGTVVNALAAARLDPGRLQLEITESALLQDSEGTLATLHQLRALGVKIAMDDFGTGYSSLGYLRKFPFDKIKIDQSFVRDMSTKGESMAIIRAVVAMGASLGISTTAEGVETVEQYELLQIEGCTEVQGYHFSRPRPAAEVRRTMISLGNEEKKAIG